jgi:histone deacetylase 1/2
VNDIVVVGSTASAISRRIAPLRAEFSVKDLGALHFFLGIEVHAPSSGFFDNTIMPLSFLRLQGC